MLAIKQQLPWSADLSATFQILSRAFALAIVASAFMTFLTADPASAQLSRMISNSQLSPEDIEIANAAAARLYTTPGVKVGDTTTWESEKTGAKGLVEVTKVDQGGACVSFRHTTEAGVQKRSQSASRRCRTADNSWVLTPE